MDIVQSLLKIAKQKTLPIMTLFLTAGFIVFLQRYQFQPIAKWFFIDKIPDSVVWVFPTVFIFSGIFLLLNFLTFCIALPKRILGLRVPYVSHQGGKIIKLFSKTGHEVLSKFEIIEALGLSIHRFDYFAEKLIVSGYLETDGDEFNYDGPKYWLTQKGRTFLARRFLL